MVEFSVAPFDSVRRRDAQTLFVISRAREKVSAARLFHSTKIRVRNILFLLLIEYSHYLQLNKLIDLRVIMQCKITRDTGKQKLKKYQYGLQKRFMFLNVFTIFAICELQQKGQIELELVFHIATSVTPEPIEGRLTFNFLELSLGSVQDDASYLV